MDREYELNVMRVIKHLESNVKSYNDNLKLVDKLNKCGFNLLNNNKGTKKEIKTLEEALKELNIKI